MLGLLERELTRAALGLAQPAPRVPGGKGVLIADWELRIANWGRLANWKQAQLRDRFLLPVLRMSLLLATSEL